MSDLEATAREALQRLTNYTRAVPRGYYKRVIEVLARGVLELLEERERLQAADKVAKAARAYFEVEEKRPLYRHRLKDRPAYRQLRRSLDEYEQVEALAPKGEGWAAQ